MKEYKFLFYQMVKEEQIMAKSTGNVLSNTDYYNSERFFKIRRQYCLVKLIAFLHLVVATFPTIIIAGNTVPKPDSGLIGYWKFDEGQGNIIKDCSGNGNDARCVNTAWTKTRQGTYLRLQRDSRITVNTSPSLKCSDEISLECWVYLTANLKCGEDYWNAFFSNPASRGSFQIYHRTGMLVFRTDTVDKVGAWAGTKTVLSKNQWYHLVGVFKNTAGKCKTELYVNGKLENDRTYTSQTGKIAHLSDIGTTGRLLLNPGHTSPTFISQARIYKKALSSEEVRSRFKASSATHAANAELGKTGELVERPPFPRSQGWEEWDRVFNLDYITELAQAYYYGYLDVFSYGVELEAIPPSYRALLSVKATDSSQRNGIFGIRIQFPQKRLLEKGYEYKFYFKFPAGLEPDYAVIGNKKVWDKKDGHYRKMTVVGQDEKWAKQNADVAFLYTEFNFVYANTDKDEKYLWLVKDLNRNSGTTLSLWERGVAQYGYGRRPLLPAVAATAYPEIKLPNKIKFYSLPRQQYMSWAVPDSYDHPVKWDKVPVAKPAYPTADIKIVGTPKTMRLIHKDVAIKSYALDDEDGYLPEALKIYAESGADGCYVDIHKRIKNTKQEDRLNFLPLRGLSLMKKLGMNVLLIEYPPFTLGQRSSLRLKAPVSKVLADDILYLHKNYPEFQNYIVLPEMEAYDWTDVSGLRKKRLQNCPYTADIDFDDLNLTGKIKAILRAEQWWKQESLSTIALTAGKKALNNITWTHMSACTLFPNAYYYSGGADLVLCKNIHRESLNMAIANARGNAGAYGKRWGLDIDCWFRTNIWNFHESELAQMYPTALFAGPALVMTEIGPHFASGKDGRIGTNKTGVEFLNFCRLAKTHPQRGKQIVKIGFMRGAAVDPFTTWKFWIRAFNDRSEDLLTVEKDWDLMDMFFYKWGKSCSTYSERLLTGTPFGPVNLIPWDIPLEKLKDYALVVFVNNANVMDKAQYENLKKYVEYGGTLLMAASQLRKNKQEYYKVDVSDLFGVQLGSREKLRRGDKELNYALLIPEGGNVLEKFSNGDPLLVEKKTGKGRAYLFATDYLTDREKVARELVGRLAEKTRAFEFFPFSGWLEYMVQKKGDIYIIPIINQGRGRFPSGNGIDHGDWKGKLLVDLNKLGLSGELEAQKVEWDAVADKFRLTPLTPHNQGNGKIALDIAVNRWCEILLGPKGKTTQCFFFGTKNKDSKK